MLRSNLVKLELYLDPDTGLLYDKLGNLYIPTPLPTGDFVKAHFRIENGKVIDDNLQ